ncbi:glutamate racemase [Taklimakanibacter deserti]|uniref:glutamate racemase n=1 Tax=Taklimakanibacter deserti TaxID=2267839 RepID=UPI000E65A7B4
MIAPRILLFDSGMGGLTVASAVRAAEPKATLIYAADNAAFPYGAWDEPALVKRIVAVVGSLIAQTRPDLVVIACNTASTLALAALREAYRVPFVGTVPAIKPAAEQTKSGLIGVLATPGTVNREYTKTLIHTYAFHCKVFLHGAKRLAEIAEAKLKGQPVDKEELRNEIAPVFRKRDGRMTDVVVLGCTHYPLLLEEIRDVAPWPVTYIDPAPAIARRVSELLRTAAVNGVAVTGVPGGTVYLTSARGRGSESLAAYASMGFGANEVLDLPV